MHLGGIADWVAKRSGSVLTNCRDRRVTGSIGFRVLTAPTSHIRAREEAVYEYAVNRLGSLGGLRRSGLLPGNSRA